MRRVTLGIISKLLFGIEAVAEANEIAEAVSVLFSRFRPFGKPFAKLTGRLPFAARIKQAEARLDKIIYELIARRRHAKDKQGDMLSVLMDLKNGENNRMSDVEVRDEALTIFLAGHETLANALTWTWYSISQHPHVEAKLHKEIETVIGSRLPDAADLPLLRYTQMVFAESMRLFPPAWTLARFVNKEYRVGGYLLPVGSVVIMSQYMMHHDPRYFPAPQEFDPERWRPEAKAARPQYSYFPFGAGPRRCIGEGMSWMEGVLLIATIAQRWHLRLVRNHRVRLEPAITLRPKHGIMMEAVQRG